MAEESESPPEDFSQTRHAFLDCLWLPVPVADLSVAQIEVTNRFRERRIGQDGQFLKARHARGAVCAALKAVSCVSLAEIGMGKFPVDIPVERYLGIDLDDEAIRWCREAGYDARRCEDANGQFDCIIALYVFHFAVSDYLIDAVSRISTENSILIFNVIIDNSTQQIDLLRRLLPIYPQLDIVKCQNMARREYYFVLSGSKSTSRKQAASEAIQAFYDGL